MYLTEKVRKAKMECDRIVVIIFVNRLEFGSEEDYQAYPRNEEEDITTLRALRYVDVLFLPQEREFCHEGTLTGAVISYRGGMADIYELALRPAKFAGMCTMITKLVGIIQPTHIYVGRNCIQSERLLRLVMQDLLIPVEVVPVPMLRDRRGIVYDARLTQLNSTETELVAKVFPCLLKLVEEYMDGIFDKLRLISQVKFNLEEPDLRIDYVDIVEEDSFAPIATLDNTKGGLVIIGLTIKDRHHLMDNIILAPYEVQPVSFFKRLFAKKKK